MKAEHIDILPAPRIGIPFHAEKVTPTWKWSARFSPILAKTRWPPAIALPKGRESKRAQPSRIKWPAEACKLGFRSRMFFLPVHYLVHAFKLGPRRGLMFSIPVH